MGTIWHDLRYATRSLAKRPGFAFVVVLTLALGIGANTAIFSLIYGVLLRPFPYREPDRLLRVQTTDAKAGGVVRGSSLLDIEDWRKLNQSLVDIGAYTTFDSDLRGDGPAEPVKLTQMNPAALAILGANPVMGRLFLPEEDLPGGDAHKAIISYRLWQMRFSSDPNIIGRTIQTSINSFTVVGVMPPGFGFPDRTEVWTPMESWYAMTGRVKKRDSRFYTTVARLKQGVSLEQARADLDTVAAALEREYPKENEGIRIRLTPLRDAEVGNIRPYLLLLVAAVGFVLLICCANVANLLLARAAVRQREFSVRVALGATRGRLARTLLTESLLLGLAGGVIGVTLAFAGVKALLALIPVQLPFWMRIEVDTPVLLFSLAVAILTSLTFGVAPALLASRVDLSTVLKEGAKGSAGGARLRGALVVAEVALCLMLLVGAGLMMQSFLRMRQVDSGFATRNLLVARVTNFRSGPRAEASAALSQFHARVLDGFKQLPGVIGVGATNSIPYSAVRDERTKADLIVKGRSEEEVKHTAPLAGADVSPGYLETMQIPLKRGRLFDERDTPSSPMVLIVNERAAQTLWPDRDPIGQEVLWGPLTSENPYCKVVGVVGNVKHQSSEGNDGLELYYPYTQYPVTNVYYIVRTQGDPLGLAPTVRQVINNTDQNAAIVFMKTLDQLIDETLWQRRLWGVMFAIFASLALILAAIGIYGVLSYSVSQRAREMGIRLALGAQSSDVLRLVIIQGMKLALLGVALGLGAAFALARVITSLLFGITSHDPMTFVAVCVVLMGVGLLACYLPARRAAQVDPIVALRVE